MFFLLESEGLVPMRTHDGRSLIIRCTKTCDEELVLDALPRARYQLRVMAQTPLDIVAFRRTAPWILFETGLLLQLLEDEEATCQETDEEGARCYSVLALNLSDRVISLPSGIPFSDIATFRQKFAGLAKNAPRQATKPETRSTCKFSKRRQECGAEKSTLDHPVTDSL